jgi:hypothetical protein
MHVVQHERARSTMTELEEALQGRRAAAEIEPTTAGAG